MQRLILSTGIRTGPLADHANAIYWLDRGLTPEELTIKVIKIDK